MRTASSTRVRTASSRPWACPSSPGTPTDRREFGRKGRIAGTSLGSHDQASPDHGGMAMDYRVLGLPPDLFDSMFQMNDKELAARGAVRRIADEANSYPCRVSLATAELGEEMLLLPYRHQSSDSPYQASGPIYVRRSARVPFDAVNRIPPMQE